MNYHTHSIISWVWKLTFEIQVVYYISRAVFEIALVNKSLPFVIELAVLIFSCVSVQCACACVLVCIRVRGFGAQISSVCGVRPCAKRGRERACKCSYAQGLLA